MRTGKRRGRGAELSPTDHDSRFSARRLIAVAVFSFGFFYLHFSLFPVPSNKHDLLEPVQLRWYEIGRPVRRFDVLLLYPKQTQEKHTSCTLSFVHFTVYHLR